jgi:hypothetical protein
MTIRREKAVGGGLGRREFLAAGAAALAFAIVKPQSVRGAEANSKIEIGLIGCGGRGGWIAKLFQENGNYKFVAGADYFEDKVKTFATKFGVDASRSYTGLSACKKLAESKLDAVVIESPPYFHPGHAAGAVEAGRHVYLAKPPAVDVPGCTLVAESGKKATAKNLVYLIDFQTRADPIFREAVKRVHNGDIGRIVSGEAVYYCGFTFGNAEFDVKDPEVRLRHWTVDNVLSGDIITEQNVHALRGGLHLPRRRDRELRVEAVRRGLGRYRRPHVRAARHARCALLRRGQHQGLGALCRRHDEESVYRRCGREHRRVPQLDRQQEVRQPDRGPERP